MFIAHGGIQEKFMRNTIVLGVEEEVENMRRKLALVGQMEWQCHCCTGTLTWQAVQPVNSCILSLYFFYQSLYYRFPMLSCDLDSLYKVVDYFKNSIILISINLKAFFLKVGKKSFNEKETNVDQFRKQSIKFYQSDFMQFY